MNTLERFTRWKLVLLAIAMTAAWHLASPSSLGSKERELWEKVRSAQTHLAAWREETGHASPPGADPWSCGLIGVEWSGATTTLGDLAAKRTACNPAWAVQFLRWFDELGLGPGDRVVIYSSASFPAMLLNAAAAAEMLQLDVFLVVSLGASTWGANQPGATWPDLSSELRRAGYLQKRADFYTLGGEAETGIGMAPEGRALLIRAAERAGVGLLQADGLADMVRLKSELLRERAPVVLVSIGGSHANLGDDPAVLELPPGLLGGDSAAAAGTGVIAYALGQNIPVIHVLNLKRMAAEHGIPWDSQPRPRGPSAVRAGWSLAGLLLFFIVVLTHRRWRLV